MKLSLSVLILTCLLSIFPMPSHSAIGEEKNHDFIPRVHNLIFIFDVSDSMFAGHPENFDSPRLFIATRGFMLFNAVMPHVPRWQYDLNTALITFGDNKMPCLRSPLAPWNRAKYKPFYDTMRTEKFAPYRTATLQDALQLAGELRLYDHQAGRAETRAGGRPGAGPRRGSGESRLGDGPPRVRSCIPHHRQTTCNSRDGAASAAGNLAPDK